MLTPNQPSQFDICLTDNRSQKQWYLKFVNGVASVQRASFSRESFALDIRQQGKRIGNFDEQNSWSGGRGNEFLRNDTSAFFDSRNMWTLQSGHAFPSLKWYFPSEYRVINSNFDDSPDVVWRALLDTTRYIEIGEVMSAQTADYAQLWIRRVGTPGTLTFELCSNSSGDPGSALQTVTKTVSDVTDVLSVLLKFDWSGTQSLTGATTYHVKIYGAANDNQNNHWEVGVHLDATTSQISSDNSTWVDADFALLYRIADADVARRWRFFRGNDTLYVIDTKDAASASALYEWNETTDSLGVVTSTGLGKVTSRPAEFGNAIFFPQGSAVNIRRFRSATTWADDGTNKADFLMSGYDKRLGATMFRTLATNASLAPQNDSGNLTFEANIAVGNTSKDVNGIHFGDNNTLWVFKEDSAWTIADSKATFEDLGLANTTSVNNGSSIVGHDKFIYWNWLFSIQRIYAGRSEDIGFGFNKTSLPSGRDGIISGFATYVKWLFYCVDGGTSGTSSVWVYDGLAHHEVFRAWQSGVRIRDLYIQNVDGERSRLWIDCGSDMVYMILPLNKSNPLEDSGIKYTHEGELVSSILDMGTSSDLPKFIKELVATTRNLNGSGIRIQVQYQLDDDIGSSDWKSLGDFLNSPEDTLFLGKGDLTQFRYRLIFMTDDASIPPDLKAIVPNGYARTEYKWTWTMNVVADRKDAEELDAWLSEAARFPGRVHMTSKHLWMHNYYVIVSPSTGTPNDTGQYTLSLLEA